ncbi:ABC transporter substrate-binding protein [Martelella sp. HB161492]|uniref:ABC transporter substrate-binding protein n=1 Tax=Martelella sp. HB161492 TaxID=2720726 RepID=UPI00159029AA|nr:ABC transporter substrate-binding protein [Martelella sp. HB161492]
MSAFKLKLGLSDSDRTRPLANGEAPIEGIDTEISMMGVQALFNRQLSTHDFDVCEFPLATYLRTLETAERPYLAIPIFPSRHFRFSSIYVKSGRGFEKPADLAGKRIGIPVFDMAAAVWLRGIFHDAYGLDRTSPTYVIGGFETPRTGDEHPQFYPGKFTFEDRRDMGLAQLLAKGEIDALYTARAPSTWPSAEVDRLFADPKAAEIAYFNKTGIFPAMHVLAIKRPIAEAHPHVVPALFDAFSRAQQIARARLFEAAALSTMLPWQMEALLETEAVMGKDYWPAGLAGNRVMLETIIRYMLEDGLISTAFAVEDLFSADMLES